MQNAHAMFDKTILLVLILATAATSFAQGSAPFPKPDPFWKEIASATYIAKGRLKLPAVKGAATLPNRGYVRISLHGAVILKQTTNAPVSKRGTITFRHFVSNEAYATPKSLIKGLHDKEVIVFLTAEPRAGELYLAHGKAVLQRSTPELVERIQNEVRQQGGLLAAYPNSEAAKPDAHDKVVSELIEGFLTPSAKHSFKQLEQMDWDAVPSMIRRMDDHRLVGKPISLENRSPKAFEAVRHYRVANVLQALDALLEQITGEIFGHSCSEGDGNSSEEISLAGWRINLIYGFPNRPKQ